MVLHNTVLFPQTIFLKSNDGTLNNDSFKSSVFFELKNAISIPQNIDGYIQLNNFKFINSFYNINEFNNNFYYTYYNGSTYSNYSFELAVGNYNITTLLNALNTELTGRITLTYNSMTFKITFQASLGCGFTLNSGENNMLSVIGFDEATQLANSIISTNLINLAGVQSLYICMDNLSITSNTSKTSRLNNILECINIAVPTGNTQVYQNTTNTRYKIAENNITNLTIKMYDENYNLVDFNNTNWSLSINFIFVYNMEYKEAPNIGLIQDNNQNDNPEIEQAV